MTSLQSLVADFRCRHRIPAVGAALVDRTGLTDAAVVGTTRRGGSVPVGPADPWHLGSCGKSITAALYARLVERGDAAWGVPLPTLFPDLRCHGGWEAVTIDDVLVHRSGIPANLLRPALQEAARDRRSLLEQRTEAAARVLARLPDGHGRFRYSNLGYVVAGAAIERITGLAYEAALAAHVLYPLGMASAGFGPPARIWGHGGRLSALAGVGAVAGRGRPTPPDALEADNPPVTSPAGRLHATLEDWARFQRVFAGGGAGFLAPATVDRLMTPVSGPGPAQAMGWATPGRSFPGVAMGQQGSNTLWSATALVDAERRRTALVTCNDGRSRVMARSAMLAARILAEVGEPSRR